MLAGLFCGCAPAALPPAAASPSPTATAVISPTAPAPTPTFAEPAPLSAEGPWLLFQHPLENGSGYEIILTNLDASGAARLDLPAFYGPLAISPDGNHAAVRITDPSLPLSDRVLSASLWVISLPGGRVLRRIPLTGEVAANWLAENPPDGYQGLTTAILEAPYLWSPDGQFLAFSGALDGQSTDLYLFVPAAGQIVQLTDGAKQTVILAWSPDSRWILHEASLFYQIQDRVVYATWAASVDGDVNRLGYGPFNRHPIIGWLAPDVFLTYTRTGTGASDELRTVNLITGRTQFIFDQPFLEAAFDPHSETILINQQPVDFASVDALPGIYTLDGGSGETELLLPGRFNGLSWQAPWDRFTAVQGETTLVFFDRNGQTLCSLPFPLGSQFGFSPDGRWLVISGPSGGHLYSAGCNSMAQLDPPGDVLWLPDSNGIYFLRLESSGFMTIERYLKSNAWQIEILKENLPNLGTPVLISP